MPHDLNNLASDFRLHDLFGDDQFLVVTQIWVLEIGSADSSELRFLYGRSLPGTYQSNSWSGTTSSNTSLSEKRSTKTHALTLNTSALQLKTFLEHFIGGETLKAASQLADLQLNEKLAAKVGATIFGANPIARPVMHLPTRDYFKFRTNRLSPTSYASVDSAAIAPEGKAGVFDTGLGSDRKIAEAACLTLNADTGLDFSALDAWRVGDFEFICAPSLTRTESRKYNLKLKGHDASIELFESLTRDPSDLLVVLNAYSDNCVQATYTAVLDKHAAFPLKHDFKLEALENLACTSYTLEIYALIKNSAASFLVLQTGNNFFRSVNLNIQMVEPIRSYEKLGWLEKQVPTKEKAKLEATGRVGRAIRPSRSIVGGRESDPWVTLNRIIETTIKELCPKSSKGRFFLKLTDSGGTSRLQLTEWLRNIFEHNHDAQIAWIDPFMEDVGIELLHRMGTSTGDYLIITTEKAAKRDDESQANQPNRIERLLDRCDEWGKGYFGNVRLKVLTVPESKIHDRMILIRSANGRPVAGYHLSNSIQRANDNLPMLATPIPLDVMQHVFEYTDQIIQSTLHGDSKLAPTAKLIFDSTTAAREAEEDEEPKGLNHGSSFIEAPRAGDVLAWWLDDKDLAGLSGTYLMKQLEAKGQANNGELDRELFDRVPPKFWSDGLPIADFHSAWDAMGFVLANSHAGQLYSGEAKPLSTKLQNALLDYLNTSRADALPPRRLKTLLDLEHYRSQDLIALLLSTYDPHEVFPYSQVDTSWGDYYALKLLWAHAPQALVDFLSSVCAEPIKDVRTHVLVVEAFKRICLCLGFDKNALQIEALLRSETSLLTWVGLHAFKDAINASLWDIQQLYKIDQIAPASAHRTILCWMINEANYVKSDARRHLILKLTLSLEKPLSDQELQDILQPLRGRLGRLHHFTPWILESMLVPMLESKTVDAAQVAREWLNDLITQWRKALSGQSLYFTLEADGAFTDEVAVLTSLLAPEEREAIINELSSIFNALARTIRQPFSAQISWRSFSLAHEVNLWVYSLARRLAALFDEEIPQSLTELLKKIESIINRNPDLDRQFVHSTELISYMKGDPDQIKSHSLRNINHTAPTRDQ